MLFNSIQFFLFLPVVFILYWALGRRYRTQNVLLVVASYIFYGWWNPELTLLIFGVTLTSYLCGRAIVRWQKRAWLFSFLNIFVSLSVLVYFKYINFFADSLKMLLSQFGYEADWFTIEVLLPVGISFYTFQAISYTVDIYRSVRSGKETTEPVATKDFIAYCGYISFFPQLVAGPIERSRSLLPQFLRERRFDYAEAVSGLRLILWGLVKKVVIADNCAYFVNNYYGEGILYPWQWAVISILFTFQIFGDFSGYSDIAIGAARLFNIRLNENFQKPFLARNVKELWRRWHISLTRWFTDYLYIPLGGNKKGLIIKALNILIVFSLSGLWHGASITFLFWGIYCGVCLIVWEVYNKCLRNWKFFQSKPIANGRPLSIREWLGTAFTFLSLAFGFGVFFRANDLSQTKNIIYSFLHGDWTFLPGEIWYNVMMRYTVILCGLLILTEWLTWTRDCPLDSLDRTPAAVRWGSYIGLTLLLLVFAGTPEEFFYFQF